MEILILIFLLLLVIYFRWLIAGLVALIFTIGGNPLAGIVAGFVCYWLLKLIGWWLAYCVFKSVDSTLDQTKKDGG